MTDEELLMYAYYYSFDKTGQVEIDRILSAVACAGKAFHYTGDWNDEATPRTFHEGATPIDWIQNRAKEAATTIEALRAELADMRERCKLNYELGVERGKMDAAAEIARLHQAMHDIYEVYAGSEGTAGMKNPELYLQGCVQEMAYIAGKHKRGG